MSSISDTMLDSGCVTHIGAVHGFAVKILTGPDAGKLFFANAVETESDFILDGEISSDRRGKKVIRFQDSQGVPKIPSQGKIEIDGKIWSAVVSPGDGYLTTDFELKEVTRHDQ